MGKGNALVLVVSEKVGKGNALELVHSEEDKRRQRAYTVLDKREKGQSK